MEFINIGANVGVCVILNVGYCVEFIMNGANVGLIVLFVDIIVGFSEGIALGIFVELVVSTVGMFVGDFDLVGLVLGETVGSFVGKFDGFLVVLMVGVAVVGWNEGEYDGITDGKFVVGRNIGETDGLIEGNDIGASVVMTVGASVVAFIDIGAEVGIWVAFTGAIVVLTVGEYVGL